MPESELFLNILMSNNTHVCCLGGFSVLRSSGLLASYIGDDDADDDEDEDDDYDDEETNDQKVHCPPRSCNRCGYAG
eukprot:1733122-Amphidinium_carterae.1